MMREDDEYGYEGAGMMDPAEDDDDEDYYDEYGYETAMPPMGDGMEMYQDGIQMEDDISDEENARKHKSGNQRRRRRGRRTAHRYPHKTHQRRVTEHSLGD